MPGAVRCSPARSRELERAPLIHPSAGLVGEFYQLVLAATYHGDGLWGEATFDLYPRALPPGWGYLVSAGLEPALAMLEQFSFTAAEVAALAAMPAFARVPASFFDALGRLRFEGDVFAIPEGTPVFPNEPVMRITAPVWVATLLETRLLQIVGTSISVASRASRLVDAAAGRPVLEFGSRRSAGGESSTLASRAAWIGGVAATTNAYATMELGIPPFGTMSDTFLAAYGSDPLAYDAFRVHFPQLGHFALPDDDPLDGVRRFAPFRDKVVLVRIDHDDLGPISRTVRAALDEAGMKKTKILGSGQLDEAAIERLVRLGAPIDHFAVGRALAATVEPGIKMAFRIAEISRGTAPVPATRAGAARWPGRKQVIRLERHDFVCLESEAGAWSRTGWPLLQPVLRRGARLASPELLTEARDRRSRMVGALPVGLRAPVATEHREVRISDKLAALALA